MTVGKIKQYNFRESISFNVGICTRLSLRKSTEDEVLNLIYQLMFQFSDTAMNSIAIMQPIQYATRCEI